MFVTDGRILFMIESEHHNAPFSGRFFRKEV